MPRYDEDTLVQQTTADYLRDALGWDVVYAQNEEAFGPEKTDIDRVKKVAAELRATLKAEKLRVENWREKEATVFTSVWQ